MYTFSYPISLSLLYLSHCLPSQSHQLWPVSKDLPQCSGLTLPMNPHLEKLQNRNRCIRVILLMIGQCSTRGGQTLFHSRHQFQEQQPTFVLLPNLIRHLLLFSQGNLPCLNPSSSHQWITGVIILTGLQYLPGLLMQSYQDLGVHPLLNPLSLQLAMLTLLGLLGAVVVGYPQLGPTIMVVGNTPAM